MKIMETLEFEFTKEKLDWIVDTFGREINLMDGRSIGGPGWKLTLQNKTCFIQFTEPKHLAWFKLKFE